MAEQADHDRGHEHGQHLDIAEMQLRRQQYVEGGRHRQEIGDTEEDLDQRGAGAGQRQLVATPPQGTMEEAAPDHVGDHQEERRAAAPRHNQGGRPVAIARRIGSTSTTPPASVATPSVKVAVKYICTMATSPMPSPRSE